MIKDHGRISKLLGARKTALFFTRNAPHAPFPTPVITLHTKPYTPHSLFGLMLVNTIGVMTESALFPNSVVPKILHFANLVYS